MKRLFIKTTYVCVIAAFAFLGDRQADAAMLTFQFSGTVDSTFFDPSDPFAGSISAGTMFMGTYTFDSATADGIPSASAGSYSHVGAPFTIQVDIGGNGFSTSELLNIGVANDIGPGSDQYSVLGTEGVPFVSPLALSIQLFLEDTGGTALGNDMLPLSPPDTNAFGLRSFFLDASQVTASNDILQFQIQGTIDEIVMARAVPAPAPVWLLGAGLLAWRVTRRQRASEPT